jgi:transposase
VPVLPCWITEPLWDQFAALLPEHVDTHPLGCHRRRIPDRIIFDKLMQVLVFGAAYERIADHTCSARTLRRRRDEWIATGVHDRLHQLALAAYDRMLGLNLEHLAVDGCITKAPCGGQAAGDGAGIPLGAVAAPANRRDDSLLAATLDTLQPLGPLPGQPTVHLDAGYDYQPCRDDLARRGMIGQIATRVCPPQSRLAGVGSSSGPMPG